MSKLTTDKCGNEKCGRRTPGDGTTCVWWKREVILGKLPPGKTDPYAILCNPCKMRWERGHFCGACGTFYGGSEEDSEWVWCPSQECGSRYKQGRNAGYGSAMHYKCASETLDEHGTYLCTHCNNRTKLPKPGEENKSRPNKRVRMSASEYTRREVPARQPKYQMTTRTFSPYVAPAKSFKPSSSTGAMAYDRAGDLQNVVSDLMEVEGISPAELARTLCVGKSRFTDWLSGRGSDQGLAEKLGSWFDRTYPGRRAKMKQDREGDPKYFQNLRNIEGDSATLAESSDQDVYVPIRLEMSHDEYVLKDTFLWNLRENPSRAIDLALVLCSDLNLPSYFVSAIVDSIHKQIGYFSDENIAPTSEIRVPILLDLRIGDMQLKDQFEWNLVDTGIEVENFAKHLVADLGLPLDFGPAVSHAIREQLQQYGPLLVENDLINVIPRPINQITRNEEESEFHCPSVFRLTEEEIQELERLKNREDRYRRRAANY